MTAPPIGAPPAAQTAAPPAAQTARFRPPGSDIELVEERDDSGRLVSLIGGGRLYVWDGGGRRHFDGGVTTSEAVFGSTLVRSVVGHHGSWTEHYRHDADGRLVEVDGVRVERDSRGRVVACGDWLYAYAGDDLSAITTPAGVRHISRDRSDRPVRFRNGHEPIDLAYDGAGRRVGLRSPPGTWHRDDLGRLWTVTRPDGSVAETYLWDGFACLGRIDGPPGDALAAVFSLDPTCTPVRIIERDRVTRVPRDAFGEALLAYPGVPGLFGGAHHDGLVHYLARPLDPRLGAYAAPDPWNGGPADPRRTDGYRGTLLVERGAYTVAMNDPLGRVDPTGEISAGLVISTLTWSWQNNLVGWLAMDFFLNFWYSVFASIGDGKHWDRFSDFTGLKSSDHIGASAVLRDGMWTKRDGDDVNSAWTFQHMAWAGSPYFDERLDVQNFNPGAEFRPHHYGSILHVRPVGKPSFLLSSDTSGGGLRPNRPGGWSRGATRDADRRSVAEAIWEGSIVPTFPTGSLHFDSTVKGTRGLLAAQVAELAPSGAFGLGTIEGRSELRVAGTGLGLAVGATVSVGNGEGVISRVVTVTEDGSNTTIRIEDDASAAPATGSRIRAVARQTEEDVPRGTAPEHLNIVASSTAGSASPNDYDVGDFLRISEAGTATGARRVTAFEARFTIDSALPTGVTAPITMKTMTETPGGSGRLTADPPKIRITVGPPTVGTGIAVTVGATVIPAFVEGKDPADAQVFILDRPLYSGASQDGTIVNWRRLAAAVDLATAAPAPTGTDVVYAPVEIRRAPGTGFVSFESAGGHAIRTVTSRAYDSLILNAAVPGAADPVHVERFTAVAGGLDLPVDAFSSSGALTILPGQVLFDAAADTSRIVLHLFGLSMTALAAGTRPLALPATVSGGPIIPPPTFAGRTMTIPHPVTTVRDRIPGPGMPVILDPAAGPPEANVISEVFVTLRLDRAIAGLGTNLRVAELVDGSFVYDGTRVDGTTVTALPNVDGTGRVQMPQFWAGEIVRVAFTAGGNNVRRYFRITAVDGTTLTLAGDTAVPAAAASIRVTRMNPTDPLNGSHWAGIDGAITGAGNNSLRVKVWTAERMQVAASAPGGPLSDPLPIAIVDGATAHPAEVIDAGSTLEIVFATAPVAASYDVTFSNPTFNIFVTNSRGDGDAYILGDLPAAATANPQNLVVAVAYTESGPPVDGELSPGTVLVPDIETFEIDRRQSLVDHELTHTVQSARWGPMLLCFLPIQLLMIDKAVELIPGVVTPEFSAYLPGTLKRTGANYDLTVANAAGVTFAAEDVVEVTLEHVALRGTLGAKAGDAFPLVLDGASELAAGLGDGVATPVQVRRNTSPGFWGHFGRNLLSALQLSTHGGVLNLTVGSTYGGLFSLLARLVYAGGRAIFVSTQDYPATVVESGAAIRLTSDAGKAAFRNEARVSVKGDHTVVRAISAKEEDGALLRLAGAVPDTWTEVRASVYSTQNPQSPFDWHTYHPANVPDGTKPAEVRVDKTGSSFSLAFRDEVWLRDGTTTWTSRVIKATDEGTTILVELNKPVVPKIIGHEFLLAKVDAGSPGADSDEPVSFLKDPLGFLSEDLMNLVGAGWMRWVFNPWGEALGRLHAIVPDDTFWWKFLRVFTHIAHTSLSTYGWSIMPPAFGWLLWDREFTGNGPHMSYTEQEASSASGNLYSPAGRLFGTREEGSFIYVGDVLRYIYYQDGSTSSVITGNQLDRAGVLLDNDTRMVVSSAVTDPGRGVPDLLYAKDLANPYAVGDSGTGENNFAASNAGWIPASDRLQLDSMMYVTFSRPSGTAKHRVTVSQGIPSRADGIEASDYQPLVFDLEVRDVTVLLAGQAVANDATVRLVQGQRARLRVTPEAGRRYAASLQRPASGTVLRLDTEGRIVAGRQAGTEGAQVDRVHEADDLLTHLRRRIVVPLREFAIEVVPPPILAALPATADAVFAGGVANPRPGEIRFVIVPAPTDVALHVDAATLGGLAAPTIEIVDTPAALVDFVADGAISRITFAAGDTPAAPVNVVFRVTIRADPAFELQVPITVDPP